MKKLLIAFLMILTIAPAMAERATVSARVVGADDTDVGLAGVAVLDTHNNKNYTTTDNNGKFSITVQDTQNDSLEFSILGYQKKLLGVRGIQDTVVLELDTEMLEGTVISGLRKNGDGCSPKAINNDPFATDGKWHKQVLIGNNNFKCIPQNCENGFTVNKSQNKCVVDCDKYKDTLHAKQIKNKQVGPSEKRTDGDYSSFCYPTSCKTPEFKLSGNGETAECVCNSPEYKDNNKGGCESTDNNDCTSEKQKSDANALSAKMKKGKCELETCIDGFKNVNGKCVSQINEKCPIDTAKSLGIDTAHAKTITIQKFKNNQITGCEIIDCDTGYLPNNGGTACKEICSNETIKTLKDAGAYDVTISSDGETCVAKSCKCEYKLVGEKCEKRSESDKNCTGDITGATAATLVCEGEKSVCRATKCDTANGYELTSDGKCACTARGFESKNGTCTPKMVLSKDKYEEEIEALSKNAQAARENETSTANKAIGAAGIGATGAGGAMLGAAIYENIADDDAERAMRAYLETFRCDYGNVRDIHGGETGIQLPGGNDMVSLYTRYATQAKNLKELKETLGLRPGIESEIVIDKASTGLYDDVGTGINGGAYASIARAIMDPDGADAALWAAQRETTRGTLIAGAVTAGIGAVGSAAANIAVNHDKGDKSREILAKYEQYRTPFKQAETKINENTPRNCAALFDNDSQVTGTYPNCDCKNDEYYFTYEQGCLPCTDDLKVNSDKTGCECKNSGYVQVSDTSKCEPPASSCTIKHYKQPNECKCIGGATPTASGDCECDGTRDYKDDGYNGCTKEEKPTPPVVQPGSKVLSINLKTSALFNSGKADLKNSSTKTGIENAVTEAIQKAQKGAKEKGQELADLKTSNDYCLWVVGKTDHQGFRKPCRSGNGKYCDNISLSKARAETIKTVLEGTNQFNGSNIQSYGIADADCTPATRKPPEPNDQCRVVEVVLLHGSCDSIGKSDKLADIIKDSGVVSDAVNKLQEAIIKK